MVSGPLLFELGISLGMGQMSIDWLNHGRQDEAQAAVGIKLERPVAVAVAVAVALALAL
jgi:hypothetical protein